MSNIKLFESKKIRSQWDADKETWYFSIVDVIAVLTESPNPQVYWRVMKKRLLAEGNETVTNCNGLKMEAPDGKMRLTDVQIPNNSSNSSNPFHHQKPSTSNNGFPKQVTKELKKSGIGKNY